jgi:hypothetical protein
MKVHAQRGPAPAQNHRNSPTSPGKTLFLKRKGSKKGRSENEEGQEMAHLDFGQQFDVQQRGGEATGASLPLGVLRKMEQAYKTDFSKVKVVPESQLAQGMGAWAFAKGRQIHFAPGRYAPHTLPGQELIGHELGHVVQQGADRNGSFTPQNKWHLHQNPRMEAEADKAGKWAAKGNTPKSFAAPVTAGAVAKGAVQAYFPQGNFKIADDMSMAVENAGKDFFARKDQVDSSNAKLQAVQSQISLIANAEEKEFVKGKTDNPEAKTTLVRVTAENKENSTLGAAMTTWADCGKTCQLVTGGKNKEAQTSGAAGTQSTYDGSPVKMRRDLMRNWLDHKIGLQETDPKEKKKMQKAITKFEKATKPYDQAKAKLVTAETALKNAVNEKQKTKAAGIVTTINASIQALDYARTDALWSYYLDEMSSVEKDAFDAQMGINRYAKADVGQGYLIVSSDFDTPIKPDYSSMNQIIVINPQPSVPDPNRAKFNFHFAGIVMLSADKMDQVSLENLTVGDKDIKNTDWKFKMYGPLSQNQGFHSASKGIHGKNPTTFNVKGV